MNDLISRAEAIKRIEGLVSTMSVCLSREECNGMRSMKERAINAVKNLPPAQLDVPGVNIEDTISRQAAIDALIRKMGPHNNGDGTMTICVMSEGLVRETLNTLPSVELRKGKWIICSDGYYPYCSVCNYRPHEMTNYCPNCGADMRCEQDDR